MPKRIDLKEIPEEFHKIYLHNNKHASLIEVIVSRVPDINPDKDTLIFRYNIPCPVCGYEKNVGYSYNGFTFANAQLCCKGCGVFFRPVIRRDVD